MAKKRDARSDRYDVSGNVEAQYVDDAQTVLANKRGRNRAVHHRGTSGV